MLLLGSVAVLWLLNGLYQRYFARFVTQ
jgi:hypothetical protein